MAKKRKMDPKLIAAKQQHEIAYLCKKYRLNKTELASLLKRAGRSRKALTSLLR